MTSCASIRSVFLFVPSSSHMPRLPHRYLLCTFAFYQIESGILQLYKEKVSVVPFLRESFFSFRAEAVSRGVTLDFAVPVIAPQGDGEKGGVQRRSISNYFTGALLSRGNSGAADQGDAGQISSLLATLNPFASSAAAAAAPAPNDTAAGSRRSSLIEAMSYVAALAAEAEADGRRQDLPAAADDGHPHGRQVQNEPGPLRPPRPRCPLLRHRRACAFCEPGRAQFSLERAEGNHNCYFIFFREPHSSRPMCP